VVRATGGVWGTFRQREKRFGEKANKSSPPKSNFLLEMAFCCILSGIFVRVLARKMLNFPLEVVIWWTLKMHFWEIVNTLLES